MKKVIIFIIILTLSAYADSNKSYIQLEEDTTTTRERRQGMVISGGCMLGVSYGLALIVTPILASSTGSMDQRVAKVLWIPFAGPLIAGIVDGLEEPVFNFATVSWTMVETIGGILLIRGLVGDKTRGGKRISLYPVFKEGRITGAGMGFTLPL